MQNFIGQFQQSVHMVQQNLPFALTLVGGLWAIHLVNVVLGGRLKLLGIYPRKLFGLVGIAFSPLLHDDFNHLFFNSIPLVIFMSLVMISGYPVFYCITLIIIVGSGLLVWLFGRRAIHIGASSLIMGYLGYLLTLAYYQPSAMTVLIGIVCAYYFGGMLFSILPGKKAMSWEGHLFGLVAGVASPWICMYLMTHQFINLR